MSLLETIKTVLGLNGHAISEPEAEPDLEVACPDDEETKTMIELDADEAEELLNKTAAEQSASVKPFAMETINLHFNNTSTNRIISSESIFACIHILRNSNCK